MRTRPESKWRPAWGRASPAIGAQLLATATRSCRCASIALTFSVTCGCCFVSAARSSHGHVAIVCVRAVRRRFPVLRWQLPAADAGPQGHALHRWRRFEHPHRLHTLRHGQILHGRRRAALYAQSRCHLRCKPPRSALTFAFPVAGPRGTFGNVTGLSACFACPGGRFVSSTGQRACWACPAGFYWSGWALHASQS